MIVVVLISLAYYMILPKEDEILYQTSNDGKRLVWYSVDRWKRKRKLVWFWYSVDRERGENNMI